ncbi:hypothetical protein [Loktanella sp. S4079]|uniref:hypothetical protein n=1 Tax=Loktanella sp. S4079 TaxID=579483 RepID=UPI000B0FC220|nr:hypothetical protein [Loktanella sp. S4079]
MKQFIFAAVCAVSGTGVLAQDFYAGGTLDYAHPHSGDAQTVGSLVGGIGWSQGRYGYGAEVELGGHIGGDADYGTQRLRGWGTYDLGRVAGRIAGGITEYDLNAGTASGYNLGVGVETAFSDRVTLRAEFIRDFMEDNSTAAVTTTRIGAFYNF